MITKTFRAQNMLMALHQVQIELGPDAMIISMREVPAGPLWAAWRKPGVEVIASKSSKETILTKSVDLKVPSIEKTCDSNVHPTSEELKREIENLKLIHSGQKISLEMNQPEKRENFEDHKPIAISVESTKERKFFENSDFTKLPTLNDAEKKHLLIKIDDTSSTTESFNVENLKNKNLPAALQVIKQKLLDQGVNSELTEKIIYSNIDSLSPAALNDLPRLTRFIMHQLIVCLTPAKKSMALVPSRVMVLTGTSGSGKTASCAKLASFYMLTMGKKVIWIEADTVRTSAISEARTYTETLGIPLFLAYTPQELSELINSQTDADLILVDTSSCNPRDEDKVTELGSYLSNVPPGSAYLVASATTKELDLIQTLTTFKQFGIKGLILTKTDETGSFGSSFNFAWLSKLPLYFFTSGNQIFNNLKPGNPDQLVTALFDGEFPRD